MLHRDSELEGPVAGSWEHDNEYPRFIKGGEFIN
jgi:hypothetical protein